MSQKSISLDFLNRKWMFSWVQESAVKFLNFKENLSEVLFFIGRGFQWCQSKPRFKNFCILIAMTLTFFRAETLSVRSLRCYKGILQKNLFKSIIDRIENVQKNLTQSLGRLLDLRTLYEWRSAILNGKQNYWSREMFNLKIEPILVSFCF